MVVNQAEARTRRVMHGIKPRVVSVSHVEQITPNYVRITFTGEDLSDFVSLDPDDHIKLVFPTAPDVAPPMPTPGERGPVWPDGEARPTMRDYTPRRYDPEQRTLHIDFVIHGDGPASNWAKQATVGQQLGVLGPRGSKIVANDFDWYLMLGDETVLPSIARRLEEFAPGTKAIAVIEVDSKGHEQQIDTAADAQLIWVHRNGAAAGATNGLELAIRALELPEGDGYVWAGGEALSLKPIRRHLLRERGLRPEWASFSGHWKRGVANHDHHEPIED